LVGEVELGSQVSAAATAGVLSMARGTKKTPDKTIENAVLRLRPLLA
jgi:hypothetical protein